MPFLEKSGALSTQLAVASFGIGTVLFFGQLAFPRIPDLLFIGLFYVLIAFVLNLLVLLQLLYLFAVYPAHREYFAIKILLMLVNLPIVALYLYLLFFNIL